MSLWPESSLPCAGAAAEPLRQRDPHPGAGVLGSVPRLASLSHTVSLRHNGSSIFFETVAVVVVVDHF